MKLHNGLIAFCMAAGVLSLQAASAQTETVAQAGSPRIGFRLLHSFEFGRMNASAPSHGLVQASDGNFYGLTYNGGRHKLGTVFRLRPGGGVVTLHSFSGPDGARPEGGLIQASDGNLYGTTTAGGEFNDGSLFRITPDGQLTTLHSFSGTDTQGRIPRATLVQASDGNLYGATTIGGVAGLGSVFRMSLDGAVTTVYSFNSLEGPVGVEWPLIQAKDGHLYGTSYTGGNEQVGTIFKVTLDGKMTILKSFAFLSQEGGSPDGGLLEGLDGNLYGTTLSGGRSSQGVVFAITTEGAYTRLHSFASTPKAGRGPQGTLVQGPDGSLYGCTNSGGTFGDNFSGGTVFRMTLDGRVAALHAFDPARDGSGVKTLVRSADGRLYGTAEERGTGGGGTLFALGEKPVRETAASVPDR